MGFQRPRFRDGVRDWWNFNRMQPPRRFGGKEYKHAMDVRGTRMDAQRAAARKFPTKHTRTIAVMGGPTGNKLLGFRVYVGPTK